ncbi:MAG: hypothetical protein DMF68_03320 [Acidobacteria bacterium]|nr:MAG: hypothetical protein DMF68_03320 [Acidobacteriota bacterium]
MDQFAKTRPHSIKQGIILSRTIYASSAAVLHIMNRFLKMFHKAGVSLTERMLLGIILEKT